MGLVVEQRALIADQRQLTRSQLELGLDERPDALPRRLVAHQLGVAAPDVQVGLRAGHLGV